MPRHYSPDRKVDAVQRLQANGGDILATHAQTGIPQRTLYTWRQELWLQQVKRQQTQPLSPPIEAPEFEYDDDIEGLLDLRKRILTLLFKLTPTIMEQKSLYMMMDRIRAHSGLVDILLKLNDFLAPYLPSTPEPPQPAFDMGPMFWERFEEEEETL